MRLNIYSEELTDRIEVVTREANGRKFHGLRFYLKSPPELHHTADDDDSSAVTFWADSGATLQALMDTAMGAALQIDDDD